MKEGNTILRLHSLNTEDIQSKENKQREENFVQQMAAFTRVREQLLIFDGMRT